MSFELYQIAIDSTSIATFFLNVYAYLLTIWSEHSFKSYFIEKWFKVYDASLIYTTENETKR